MLHIMSHFANEHIQRLRIATSTCNNSTYTHNKTLLLFVGQYHRATGIYGGSIHDKLPIGANQMVKHVLSNVQTQWVTQQCFGDRFKLFLRQCLPLPGEDIRQRGSVRCSR
ncbi:unnamed protein product [Ectocarpus sp. 6 AP-2014]